MGVHFTDLTSVYRTAPDTLDAIRADLDAMLGRIARVEAGPHLSDETEAVAVLARKGRELYTRRALEHAAEHAAAMMPALGLPRLVYPDFVGVDPCAALDALSAAIDALDAMDADPEAEAEPDDEATGDDEPTLGAPENHPARFYVDMAGCHHVGRAHHPIGDQSQWGAGCSHADDAEAVNEDGDDLDHGEMEEGDKEPWLGAAEGAQHYRGGDLDLEHDGEIERPWWGPHAARLNRDGELYA